MEPKTEEPKSILFATFGPKNPMSLKVINALERLGQSVLHLTSEDQDGQFGGARVFALYDWHRGNMFTPSSMSYKGTPEWARAIGAERCLRIAPACDVDKIAEACAEHIVIFLKPRKREGLVPVISPKKGFYFS